MNSSKQKNRPKSKSPLTPQAQRALQEADERREKLKNAAEHRPREIDGRDGPEPTRYGDWEKNGIISDF